MMPLLLAVSNATVWRASIRQYSKTHESLPQIYGNLYDLYSSISTTLEMQMELSWVSSHDTSYKHETVKLWLDITLETKNTYTKKKKKNPHLLCV